MKTDYKSPKKGSNIICRVANATPQKVCEYVHRLPKQIMPESQFRDYMGKGWFANEHQAPEQWGLYYIDGVNFYPRFNRDISLEEAEDYLKKWIKKLIVINPYTKFKVVNDNGLVLSIVNYIENNPQTKDLKTILRGIIGGDEPFIVNDIIANALNNYSGVLDIETISKDQELFNVELKKNYKDIIRNEYMDKKSYFDLFSGDNQPIENNTILASKEEAEINVDDYSYISAIKAKPFLILGGFSGTGKSQKVKELAFATCPMNRGLCKKETSPGNYLLISVKPNWHDATDITGFRSSVNKNYFVTDFMRFLVKAKQYPRVPFFVCLDEMNLAPVEEYFADFLSVIESRKLTSDGKIVTDAIVPASVFNDEKYDSKFNIFKELELKTIPDIQTPNNSSDSFVKTLGEAFERQDIVEELKRDGLTIPQNVIIIGTVNMDDTTNSFSRKVIDRAMTFETIVEEITDKYFDEPTKLGYVENPLPGEMFISSFVRADDIDPDFINIFDREDLKEFINGINQDLNGTPFKISYRVLNETILLYRAKWDLAMEYNEKYPIFTEDAAKLNVVFDDILMQKVLPRIEGDYDKCHDCLEKLQKRAEEKDWPKSQEKIQFMLDRFGNDKSGFTTFWN